MNLTDIIALAKQGYTPKDIKDLLDLGVNVSEDKPPEEDHTEEDKPDEVTDQKDDATQEAEQELDYKKLYEDEQQKVSDLTKKLEASQKNNTRQDMQGTVPDKQETINDLVRSFM